jgi:hypothetical protein
MMDTAFAAKRLALKGAGFATSNKVAAAMRERVAAELADGASIVGSGGAKGVRFDLYDDPILIPSQNLFSGDAKGAITGFRITSDGHYLIQTEDSFGQKLLSNLPQKKGESKTDYNARTSGFNEAAAVLNKRYKKILPILKDYSKRAIEESQYSTGSRPSYKK